MPRQNSVMRYLDDSIVEFDENNNVERYTYRNDSLENNPFAGKNIAELFPREYAEDVIEMYFEAIILGEEIVGQISHMQNDIEEKYSLKFIPKDEKILMIARCYRKVA